MFDLKIWWVCHGKHGHTPAAAHGSTVPHIFDHDTHPTTTTTPLRYVYK